MMLPSLPTLKEIQWSLRRMITDPKGVEVALEDEILSGYLEWIHANDFQDLLKRLNIYAEGYFIRIADSLEDDFGRFAEMIGKQNFLKLVADYLKVYPSSFTNIGEVGRFFPHFLSSHQAFKELPFLVDLAVLEWEMIESFYADEKKIFSSEELSNLCPESFSKLRLSLGPGVRILKSQWAVDKLWSGECHGQEIIEDETYILIYRQLGEVHLQRVNLFEYEMLVHVRNHLSLEEIFDIQQMTLDDTSLISSCFEKWMQMKLICFNS